ncbi:MAG: hypothetical protein R3C20_12220 [Planctomycetaceae bacterium]
MAAKQAIPQGSWILAEELLENGDPRFLDELRTIHDADRLGAFAVTWFNDKRAASRQLLLQYLELPLNVYRHEALVKRLYKNAEAANDTEVLSRFLLAFDRSVRRLKKTRWRYEWFRRESWSEETISVPNGTMMPRGKNVQRIDRSTGKIILADNQKAHDRLQLFSVATRKYLRRRVWRYFRKLAETDPQQYISAMCETLVRYTDADCADGLALIDNWSLMHILFHHSDVLRYSPGGWNPVEGRSLRDLKPAPAFADAWKISGQPLLKLLDQSRCRPVRQWALGMIRDLHPGVLNSVPVDSLIRWISSEDESLSDLAIDLLKAGTIAASVSTETWMELLEQANPNSLDRLCSLIESTLDPAALSLVEKVRVASARPIPVARLGMAWLKLITPTSSGECQALLQLREAQAEAIRPELIAWLQLVLTDSPHFQPLDILELLDSRHPDVREVASAWLMGDERLSGDTRIWQRLMESPYDDIQLHIARLLEFEANRPDQEPLLRQKNLDPDLVRHLWACVLLNVHRGGRQKPGIVASIIDRISKNPSETESLLPLLSIALRSVRSTEWRAGLTGLVRLIETSPALRTELTAAFPELTLT